MRWLLNVSGLPWQWLHVSLRSTLRMITIPSLHVFSENDTVLSHEQLHSLPSRSQQPTVLLHTQGHALPVLDSSLGSKVEAFLSDAVAGGHKLSEAHDF